MREILTQAVDHLQALLRIDTTNPPGNEIAAAQYIAGVLSRYGYAPEIVEPESGRGSVVTRFRGTGEREPLLLYGHTDVVPADAGHWRHDPFSGDIADGCLWGRGALDMKSLVAQELMVMLMLARDGRRLSRDVIFAATADEEAGGNAGMGYLVDHHPELVSAAFGLSEGGGTTMYIAGRPLYDIRTAEKGSYRFRIRARGEPGHGSIPRRETAVTAVARAVLTLSDYRSQYHPTATFTAFFTVLCEMLGVAPPRGTPTEEDLRRIDTIVPAGLSAYLHAISHNTAVPTGLAAGRKINVIPAEAEALVDGRYLPGITEDEFHAELRTLLGARLEIEPLSRCAPLEQSPANELYRTIEAVMRHHAPEARTTPIMLSGATDARHLARLGATCIGFGPVRIPESFATESLVHGHDERIPIDGYLWGIPVLYDVVTQFCA
jgi:acetylornithine deacetylase/succinyl-diaminopimelate desuccinylase-like protein